MTERLTPLERTARTGEFETVARITVQLRREGYATNQLEGPALRRQLRDLLRKARPFDLRGLRHLEPRPKLFSS